MRIQFNFFTYSFLLLFITGSLQQSKATQLSGTYTINPSGTATTTNFKDFASAVTYMTSTSARADAGPANSGTLGVSGPVVFQVTAATYSLTAAIIVPAITGSSSTNTVTFEGGAGNAATRIITGSLSAQALIRMNLCNYVRFRNLTITNAYSGACSGIAVVGNNTTTSGTGCHVKNCIISLSNIGTGTGYGIIVTATANGHGLTVERASEIEIDSNTVTGGSHGIVFYGNTAISTSYNNLIKIRSNTVNNSYTYGIYIYYVCNGIELSYNNITMSTVNAGTTYGVYFYYCQNAAGTASHQIIGNIIKNSSYYGFYIYYGSSSATYPTKIYNNIISGGFRSTTNYGFYIYSSSALANNYQFYHNTINMDYSATTVYGMYYYNPSASGSGQFKNNIFACTSTGGTTLYPAYFSTNPSGNVVNYNVYYNNVTANLLYRAGALTSANFQTATGGGDSSFNALPNFVGAGNLHLSDGCGGLKGLNLTSLVPLDVDRETRSVPPQIGADEPLNLSNDLKAEKLITPVAPISLGLQDLVVRVRNVGSSTIYSFNAGYVLNGGTSVTQLWTGTLAPCDTVSVTFTGGSQVNLLATNILKVFTSAPNTVTDPNPLNDTITSILIQPLNGLYTIGGSGANNYSSFASAFSALAGGATGPVTFTVAAGTYSGQLIVPAVIPGTSATRTVAFDGVDATTRIISASVVSGPTIMINQSSYIIFRNFTISNTASGTCVGVAILGTSNSNAGSGCGVKNCIVNLPNAGASTSYSINLTSSANGYGLTATRAESVEIDSNTINGGVYGICIYGFSSSLYNANIKVRNNVLNTYTYGLNIQYIYNAVDVLSNTINMSAANTGTQYAARIYYCQNPGTSASHRIIANQVNASSYYGFYIYYCTGGVSYPTQIYNNVIKNVSYYGCYLYCPTANYIEFYHNSMNMNSMNGLYGLYYYNPSGSGIFKNNIFVVSAIAGSCYPAYFSTSTAGNTVNYNIYYNSSNPNLLYRGGDLTSTSFQTSAGGGDSSLMLNPFLNNNNLHITSNCLRGVDLTASVLKDFEGDNRLSPPSIGADEFIAVTNDIAVEAVVQPANPVSAGTQDLKVRVRNNGSATVYSFTIAYSINGGTPVSSVWAGSLAPCDTTSYLFTGSQQVTISNSSNLFRIYSSAPNTMMDGYMQNDTLVAQIGPPLNGIYTIGATLSDYSSFNAAISDLNSRGVSGNVQFKVKSGTYNENLLLISVQGTSATASVTFSSMANNPDSVIINGIGGYVLNYIGASYINFTAVTFNQPVAGGSGVNLSGTSSYDTVYRCKILVPNNTSVSYTLYVNNSVLNGITFRRNTFSGSYYGIYWMSSSAMYASNCVVDSNLLNGAYYSQIEYFYYTSNLRFANNIVNFCSGGNTYEYVYWYYNSSADISGNTFNLPSADYVYWYFEDNTGTSSSPIMFRNNIMNATDATSDYELYFDYDNHFMDVYNNVISLGTGIWYLGYFSDNIRYYNNTVSSNSTSYTLYYEGVTNYAMKNNILSNTGGGYPLYYANSSPSMSNESIDYNVYYATGTNIFYDYTTSYTTIAAWKSTYPSFDKNSYVYRPPFTNSVTNLSPNLYDTACWILNGRGIHAIFVNSDINNNVRPVAISDGAPDIGAHEITPVVAPPACIATPALPAANTTQIFMFATDTVAKIYWDTYTTPPTSLIVKQYSGVKPPMTTSATYIPYFYTDFSAPSGTYLFNLEMFYRETWLGNIQSEANMYLAKKNNGIPWMILYGSTVDTLRNVLASPYQTAFALFTASDATIPLPLKLISFEPVKSNHDVLVKWITSDEVNISHFELERSVDGIHFRSNNSLNAKGNHSGVNEYILLDRTPFENAGSNILYYRLRIIDRNGAMEYSETKLISDLEVNPQLSVSIFPNPANDKLELNILSSSQAKAQVTLTNFNGKSVLEEELALNETMNKFYIDISELKIGIYVMAVQINGITKHFKFVKIN